MGDGNPSRPRRRPSPHAAFVTIMRLLQRYIFLELIKVFSFLLTVLTILLVFVGGFRQASENGLGPAQTLQILPYVVPTFMPFTIPATLLLTICVVYGRISGDQEVTAAKAAGINVLSLLAPAFLLGIVLSLASLALTDQVTPWAMHRIQKIVAEAVEDIFLDMLRTQRLVNQPQRGISVMVMDVQGKTLIRPTFRYSPPGGDPIVVQAETARVDFDLDAREIVLHLENGQVDLGERNTISIRNKDVIRFPLPEELQDMTPRYMTISQIRVKMAEIAENLREYVFAKDLRAAFAMTLGNFTGPLAAGGLVNDDLYHRQFENPKEMDLNKLHTEIHSRLAMCTSCLFFVLIGGPFSMLQARRQFLTSFIICFVPILTIYYPLVLGMMNLCKTGQANPLWAMWVGNAVLLVVGGIVLRRVLRH